MINCEVISTLSHQLWLLYYCNCYLVFPVIKKQLSNEHPDFYFDLLIHDICKWNDVSPCWASLVSIWQHLSEEERLVDISSVSLPQSQFTPYQHARQLLLTRTASGRQTQVVFAPRLSSMLRRATRLGSARIIFWWNLCAIFTPPAPLAHLKTTAPYVPDLHSSGLMALCYYNPIASSGLECICRARPVDVTGVYL